MYDTCPICDCNDISDGLEQEDDEGNTLGYECICQGCGYIWLEDEQYWRE